MAVRRTIWLVHASNNTSKSRILVLTGCEVRERCLQDLPAFETESRGRARAPGARTRSLIVQRPRNAIDVRLLFRPVLSALCSSPAHIADASSAVGAAQTVIYRSPHHLDWTALSLFCTWPFLTNSSCALPGGARPVFRLGWWREPPSLTGMHTYRHSRNGGVDTASAEASALRA